MVDISEQIAVIDTSKSGAEIKQAIWDALYILSLSDPEHVRDFNIAPAYEFVWGIGKPLIIGIPEEVTP